MDFKYCSRCKKMYTVGNLKLCAECIRELDDYMIVIRDFLDEHKWANLTMVADGTGIDERDLLYLLRSERLVLNEADASFRCESCNKPIRKGRFCDECKQNMGNSFADVAKDMQSKFAKNNNTSSSRNSAQKMQVLNRYVDKNDKF